jgi:outer membrane protein
MKPLQLIFLSVALGACAAVPCRGQAPNAPQAGAQARGTTHAAAPELPARAVAIAEGVSHSAKDLPDAPAPAPPAAGQSAPAPSAESLTLVEAEKIALQNHPQIQIAEHRAAYAAAQVQQAQSVYSPQANGNLTGVIAETDSRIAAGGLNNPVIYDRFAAGAFISQYVTDFGRTQAVVHSFNQHARAQQAGVITTRADVLLRLHESFFAALKSRALLTVARETVRDRQLVADQVGVMAQNKLKSGLDVAFASVDLSQAQLLLIQSQNDVQASYAQLSAALGFREPREFDLAEPPGMPAPPRDFLPVLQEAFSNRPELAGQRLEVSSAKSYATAERDLWFPSMSAAGGAGLVPYHVSQLEDRYAAVGFNVSIPVFNGHLFGSLRTQANEEYRAQQQVLRELEDRVARDVRTAWLNANSSYRRLSVTEQLLNEAKLAEDLAASRYRMGLSSIVELTQAQLNLTQAQIAEASAKYDYQIAFSELLYQQGDLR